MTRISKIKAFRRGGLAAIVLAAALMVPAQAAMAGENCSQTRSDPTQAQYCGGVAGVQGEGGNKHANGEGNEPASTETTVTPAAVNDEAVQATAAEESGGSLPFTGLDVGILVLVAAGLAGTGLLLRRLTGSGAIRS